METVIAPTATVHPKAQLGAGVNVGPGVVIETGVKIGDRTTIQAGVVLRTGTVIGSECRIFPYAILGEEPQDLKCSGEPSRVVIGDKTVIREFVTVHRSSTPEGETSVGNNSYLMAYTHLGHDVSVGDEVILVNGASLSGHVRIDDQAVLSGFVLVHQFVRIGRNTMIGGGSTITQDVPPYVLADGRPAKPHGLNVVGLRRRGFSPPIRAQIKTAYKLLYQSGFNTTQALEAIEKEFPDSPEIREFVDFIRNSKRGICR